MQLDWIIPLITLTAMEIVLGIDNIVFISILCGKLPEAQRKQARTIGLGLAMGTRILLLLSINWVLGLTQPVFHLTDVGVPLEWVDGVSEAESLQAAADRAAESPAAEPASAAPPASAHGAGHGEHDINGVSVRDLILLIGGLFLICSSVLEIHHKIEGEHDAHGQPRKTTFGSVLFQIAVLDIIFSLDSVITAVGMAKEIWVMVVAVILAIVVMMAFAGTVERFVSAYPTIKILALSFLILIGVLLVAEGIGTPVNKGYIYFAMAFSLAVEVINIQIRRAAKVAAAG